MGWYNKPIIFYVNSMVALGSGEIQKVICAKTGEHDFHQAALLDIAIWAIHEYLNLKDLKSLPKTDETKFLDDAFQKALREYPIEVPEDLLPDATDQFHNLAGDVVKKTIERVYRELEKADISTSAIINRRDIEDQPNSTPVFHPDSDRIVLELSSTRSQEEKADEYASRLESAGQVLGINPIYCRICDLAIGLLGKRISIQQQVRNNL